MRYSPVPPQLFIENRHRFIQMLPAGACCIIHSNDIPQTNADGTGPFVQNSNLFWLTGIDQEETILILFPDSPVAERRELLFVRQTNEHLAIWEGPKLTKAEATAISGIQEVRWTSSFTSILQRVLADTELVYLSTDHHPGRSHEAPNRNLRFANWCKETFPLHEYRNASPLLHRLRMIKSPTEVDLMRKAGQITAGAFDAALRAIKPGAFEYEIEAEIAREIIRNGARGFAYLPIIASGPASCILHYTANDRQLRDGDVLLMDFGASYANYAADMTRTIPVNGTFSARQKALYHAVLSIFRQAVSLMKPGVALDDYHDAVNAMADQALVDLGLISMTDLKTQDAGNPARNRYFLHRTTHFLGLDVHDPGDSHAEMRPGMVLTCEPGIYVREEETGIRLENNILITPDGHEDLLCDVPLDPDEIESLIHR